MARLIVCDLCKSTIPSENSSYSLTCDIETAIYNKDKKHAFNYEICPSCAKELHSDLEYIRSRLCL